MAPSYSLPRLFLLILLGFILAACGGGEQPEGNNKDISQIVAIIDGPIPGNSFLGLVDKIEVSGHIVDLADGVVSEDDLAEISINGENQTLMNDNGVMRWKADVNLPNEVNSVEIVTRGKGGWSKTRAIEYYNGNEILRPYNESAYDADRDRFVMFDGSTNTFYGIDRVSGVKSKIFEFGFNRYLSDPEDPFGISGIAFSKNGKTAYLVGSSEEGIFEVDLENGVGIPRAVSIPFVDASDRARFYSLCVDEAGQRLILMGVKNASAVMGEIDTTTFDYRELGLVDFSDYPGLTYSGAIASYLKYDSKTEMVYMSISESITRRQDEDGIRDQIASRTSFNSRHYVIARVGLADNKFDIVIPYASDVATSSSFTLDEANNTLVLQSNNNAEYRIVEFDLSKNEFVDNSMDEEVVSSSAFLSVLIGPDNQRFLVGSNGEISQYNAKTFVGKQLFNQYARSSSAYYSAYGLYQAVAGKLYASDSQGLHVLDKETGEIDMLINFDKFESKEEDYTLVKQLFLTANDSKFYFLERWQEPAEFDSLVRRVRVIEYDIESNSYRYLKSATDDNLEPLSLASFVGAHDGGLFFVNRRVLMLTEQRGVGYPEEQLYRYDIEGEKWAKIHSHSSSSFRSYFDFVNNRRLYLSGSRLDAEDFETGGSYTIADLQEVNEGALKPFFLRDSVIDGNLNILYTSVSDGIVSIDLSNGNTELIVSEKTHKIKISRARRMFLDSNQSALYFGTSGDNAFYKLDLDSRRLELVLD